MKRIATAAAITLLAACATLRGAGPAIPEQADSHRRAVRGRRHLGHPGAPDRPEADRRLGPAGDRREQARRQRQRRRRVRRQEHARRLHAAAHRRRRPGDQRERLSEAAVRSGEGLQPRRDGLLLAARARGASVGAGAGREGVRGYGESPPRQAQFRDLGHRRRAAPGGNEFAQRTGVDWTYIPYKGGSDAVTGVVAGQAHVLFNGMLATWPSVTGGKLRALGISSAQRVPAPPLRPPSRNKACPASKPGRSRV